MKKHRLCLPHMRTTPPFWPEDTWQPGADDRIEVEEIEDEEKPKRSVPTDRTRTPSVDPHA